MASLSGLGACPGCLATRKPDEIREYASVTIRALVHNLDALTTLLGSAINHGESRILMGNIEDALITSFASYLPKVHGAWQTLAELVQMTMGVLSAFRELNPAVPRCPLTPHFDFEETATEVSHNSPHLASEHRHAIPRVFYYPVIMQYLKLLKAFGPADTRSAGKTALIEKIRYFTARADPTGGLETAVKRILFHAGVEDVQKEGKVYHHRVPSSNHGYMGKGKKPMYHSPPVEGGSMSSWAPEAKKNKKDVPPSQGEMRDIPPPRPTAFQNRAIPASLETAGSGASDVAFPRDFNTTKRGGQSTSSEGSSAVAVAGSLGGAGLSVRGSILEQLARLGSDSEPQLKPRFQSWGTCVLGSGVDLYKPVLLDYLPIRAIPKQDSPTLAIDSAASPFTHSSFWRNLNLAEADNIWRWIQAYQDTAIETVRGFTDSHNSYETDEAADEGWLTLCYPRAEFVRDFQEAFQRKFGEPSWTVINIVRFLNTCGTCRSVTAEPCVRSTQILGSAGKPLLQFSIRFSEGGIVFRDFLRQIVIPASQIYTSPGKTLIITPVLYDPHQEFEAISDNTVFELGPRFDWLKWDTVVRGFVGEVPETLLRDVRAKAPRIRAFYTIEIPITARTITDLPNGVQHETRVRAQIMIRVCEYMGGQAPGNLDDKPLRSAIASPVKLGPTFEDHQNRLPEVEHERCIECDGFYDARVTRPNTPAQVLTGETAPLASDISIFLWGHGFREWLNIVFLADSHTRKVKYHSYSRRPKTSYSIGPDEDGDFKYPMIDTMEKTDLKIGVELEILSTHGDHVQLHHAVCKALEECTKAKGLFCKSDMGFMPSFTAVGPVIGMDEGAIRDSGQTNPAGKASARSTIRWTKVVLQKVLGQLEGFRDELNDAIKVHLHVGVEGIHGYDLKSIKSIAKAIVLFGGLLNGVDRAGNADHKCCQDVTARVRSNIEYVLAIQKASSMDDIVQIMNTLEASGYTHHAEADQENQRYDFNALGSQDVVVWTQVFPRLDRKNIISWISMILCINKTALETDGTEFLEFAENPITPASFEKFVTQKMK